MNTETRTLNPIEEFAAEYGDTLYSCYRAIYRGTDCGPSIGFLLNGTWVYCDDLPGNAHTIDRHSSTSIAFLKSCGGQLLEKVFYNNQPQSSALEQVARGFAFSDEADENGLWINAYDEAQKRLLARCKQERYDHIEVQGISVSSIVEGSDVDIPGDKILLADFTPEKFWELVKHVNDAANYYWQRDNSTWYHVFVDGELKAHCHWENFNDGLTWDDDGDLDDETKQKIEDAVHEHFDDIETASDTWKYDWKWGEPLEKGWDIDRARPWHKDDKSGIAIWQYVNDGIY